MSLVLVTPYPVDKDTKTITHIVGIPLWFHIHLHFRGDIVDLWDVIDMLFE